MVSGKGVASSTANLALISGLDDLCVRFIINLPKEELVQVERICFQVEEAQWYYEDFIRPLDPDLPSLNLKAFCLRIFQHCPLLSQYSEHHHVTAFEEFLAYKTRVPVRGAILLNHELDSVLLVRGWKTGASWSFPRGKINKDELDLDCAIREVWEETGFDVRKAGLVPKDEDTKYIEMSIRDQHIRLYVFRDVPMETNFEPRTRKEIGKIQWYKLTELPTQKKGKNRQSNGTAGDLATHANKFYMVAPFINGLKKWISQQKKLSKQVEASKQILTREPGVEMATPGDGKPENLHVESYGNGSIADGNNLEHLIANLHQPGKLPTSAEVLPKLTPPVEQPTDLPKLPTQKYFSNLEFATSNPTSPDAHARAQKAQSLLALLKGDSLPSTTATELPQTPSEQVIEHPHLPPSPTRRDAKLRERTPSQRSPLLRATHQAPLAHQIQPFDHSNSNIHPRQAQLLNILRSNPPPSRTEIAHHNPRMSHGQVGQVDQSDAYTPILASQPTSGPAILPSQPTGFASAIPAASKLPPPKLTAQSAKLLDLFKSNKPIQAALEAAPIEAEAPCLRVASNFSRDPAEQASLEVSEIEDHHMDHNYQSHRAPSEVSFEMAADTEVSSALPDQTPPRLQMPSGQSARGTVAAWQNFQQTDAVLQAEQRRQAANEEAVRSAEESSSGIPYEPAQPILQETWKQVKVGDDNKRRIVAVVKDGTQSKVAATQQPTADKTASTPSMPEQVHPLSGLGPQPPNWSKWDDNHGYNLSSGPELPSNGLQSRASNSRSTSMPKSNNDALSAEKARKTKSGWDDSSGFVRPLTTGPGLDINSLPEHAWNNGVDPRHQDREEKPTTGQIGTTDRSQGSAKPTANLIKIALVVSNLETEEAVGAIFPKRDRMNIKEILQLGDCRYVVFFNTFEQTRAAIYRQPRHHKTTDGNQYTTAGQPRKPNVRMIEIHPPRTSAVRNKAEGDASVGEIDGSGIINIPNAPQATQGHSSNQPSRETQTSQATVVAPSDAESKQKRSEHQNTLLNLLKGPFTPGALPTPSTLEAPNPSFELSAVPSPGHSRDTSAIAPPPIPEPTRDMGPILPMSQPTTKRAKAKLAPRKSPVSATVDGPLNVPQFDMLSQKISPAAKAGEGSGTVEAPRKSPVTILARPQNGQPNLLSANENGFVGAVTTSSPTPQAAKFTGVLQKTPAATMPHGASTTILGSPSAAVPTLSTTIAPLDTTTPLKQVAQHPQQPPNPARRPLHIRPQTHQDSVLSPISPLPSPKHSLPFDRREQQTSEQKKSLLSLFNNPAPASPAATGSPIASTSKAAIPPPPITAGSPSTLTSQSAIAPPARTQSALISPPAVQSFEQRISSSSTQAPGSLSKRHTGEVEKVEAEGRSSGRQTPKDTKSFLLGYLDSVVMGGR